MQATAYTHFCLFVRGLVYMNSDLPLEKSDKFMLLASAHECLHVRKVAGNRSSSMSMQTLRDCVSNVRVRVYVSA